MAPPSSILVLDHRDAGVAALLEPVEVWGHRVERVRDLRGFLDRLVELLGAPETRSGGLVLVIDPLAGAGEAEIAALNAALRSAADLESEPLPLLLLADGRAPVAAMRAARAYRGGPWDVVYRDAPWEEVATRLVRLEEELATRRSAARDELTGLLRRGAFAERMRAELAAARRHRFPLTIAFLDLDRFGRINKDWSHRAGDELLARVGEAIRGALRREDVAGRFGGDEIVVLLPHTSHEDAANVVPRLLHAVRGVSAPGDAEPSATASIGHATFDGASVEDARTIPTADALLARADRAQKEAKRRGGDRAVDVRDLGEKRADDARSGRPRETKNS